MLCVKHLQFSKVFWDYTSAEDDLPEESPSPAGELQSTSSRNSDRKSERAKATHFLSPSSKYRPQGKQQACVTVRQVGCPALLTKSSPPKSSNLQGRPGKVPPHGTASSGRAPPTRPSARTQTVHAFLGVRRRTRGGLGPAGPTPVGPTARGPRALRESSLAGPRPPGEWQDSPAALQTSRAGPAEDIPGDPGEVGAAFRPGPGPEFHRGDLVVQW